MIKSKRYRVIEDYQSPYPNPIIFHKGEKVTIGREFTDDPDWKDWVWCEGQNNNEAWVPKQYLEIDENTGKFITDYNALELSVAIGETLIIYKIVNGFGRAEKPDGERGWVPMKNLQLEEMKLVNLLELRPNNWYINQAKLERARAAWKNGKGKQLPPVLVTEIDGVPSLIDGHSRAFAAIENGETHINADFCELETIEGSTALYKHIHREGPRQGICSIADLRDRIVSPEEHKRLWIEYCTEWLQENGGL